MAPGGRLATCLPVVLAVATLALLARASAFRNGGVRKPVFGKNSWREDPPARFVGPRPQTAIPSAVDLPGAYSRTFAVSDDGAGRRAPPSTRRRLAKERQNSTGGGQDGASDLNGPASELLTWLLTDYDKNVHPINDDGGPVVVEINLALHKILRVDLLEGTMDLNVWFRLHWRDSRLAWNDTDWGVSRLFVLNQELRYMDIWYPDVTLWNTAYDVAGTLGAQMPIIKPTGDVYWGRNGMIQVACNFKGLASFPFGAVKCLLEFGTWSHGPLTVIVKEAPQGGATISGNSITDMRGAKAVEWKFYSVRSWIHHYPAYPCCPEESNWPVLLVDVELHRTQTLFALKILVPQVVLALVGFMTFWLSPECGERLGVAVTIPLALAVYDLLVYSTLPASDDISCIGAIGLLGFLFSVVTLAINGAVIHLFHYREPRWWMGSGTIWAIWLRFRQHQVWAALLEVLDKLETELIKQQLKESQAAKKERQAQFAPRARRLSFMGERKSKNMNQEDIGVLRRKTHTGGNGGAGSEPAAVGAAEMRSTEPHAVIGRRNSLNGTSSKARRLSGLLLVPQQPQPLPVSQSHERVTSPTWLPSMASAALLQARVSPVAASTPGVQRRTSLRIPTIALMTASTLRDAASSRKATSMMSGVVSEYDGDSGGGGGGVTALMTVEAAVAQQMGAPQSQSLHRVDHPESRQEVCKAYERGGTATTWSISPMGSARREGVFDDPSGPVAAAAVDVAETGVSGSPLTEGFVAARQTTSTAAAASTVVGEGGSISRKDTDSSLVSQVMSSAMSTRLAAAAAAAPPRAVAVAGPPLKGLQTPSLPRRPALVTAFSCSQLNDVETINPAVKSPLLGPRGTTEYGADDVSPRPPSPPYSHRSNGGGAAAGWTCGTALTSMNRGMTSPMSQRVSAVDGLGQELGFGGHIEGAAGFTGFPYRDAAAVTASAVETAIDAGDGGGSGVGGGSGDGGSGGTGVDDVNREDVWRSTVADRSPQTMMAATVTATAATEMKMDGAADATAFAAAAGVVAPRRQYPGYSRHHPAVADTLPHFTLEWATAAAAAPAVTAPATGPPAAPAAAAAVAVAASAVAAAAAAAAATCGTPPPLPWPLLQQLQPQPLAHQSSRAGLGRTASVAMTSSKLQGPGDTADDDADPHTAATGKNTRQARSLPERGGDSFIEMAVKLSLAQIDDLSLRVSMAAARDVRHDECVVTVAELASDGGDDDHGNVEGEDDRDDDGIGGTGGGGGGSGENAREEHWGRLSPEDRAVLPVPPPAPLPPPPAPPLVAFTPADAPAPALAQRLRPSAGDAHLVSNLAIGESVFDPNAAANTVTTGGVAGGGDANGDPLTRDGHLGAPGPLSRAAALSSAQQSRAPSRLRWQGSATGLSAVGGDAAAVAPEAVAAAPAATPASSRLMALTTVRSWGREGGGVTAGGGGGGGLKASGGGGGNSRFSGLTYDKLFTRPTSSPGDHLPPLPSFSKPQDAGGDYDSGDDDDDSGGQKAGASLSAPPLQSALSPVSPMSSPLGVSALSAAAVPAGPVRHIVPPGTRPQLAYLEQPARAAQRSLSSIQSNHRLLADAGGVAAAAAAPPPPPPVSGADDSVSESAGKRMMRQTSHERGGGRLQRYGTGSSAMPSQQLRRLASDSTDGNGGGQGDATNYSRSPSGAAFAAMYTEQTQAAFGGDGFYLEPDADAKVQSQRRKTGFRDVDADADGGCGGDGGGADGVYFNTDADHIAARSRRMANSEYGAWTASCGEAEHDHDPEPEHELTLDAVLHVATPEQLEAYLQLILENPSRELLAVRERVANAVNVFGLEELVMRLFPIVGRPEPGGAGGAGGGNGYSFRRQNSGYGASRRGILRGGRRMAVSSSGAAPGAVSQAGAKADFHHKVGDEYNAKWRLLSAFIDANCRYLMPLMYTVCFLLIIWAKVWADTELKEGPRPEKSEQGVEST